jgi:hypothetical protein
LRGSTQAAASGRQVEDLQPEHGKEGWMDALSSTGRVTLNADGMRYAASYQLRFGVITVTFGSVSRVIRVGETVAAPESLARTILRTMVKDNCQRADLKRETRPLNGSHRH